MSEHDSTLPVKDDRQYRRGKVARWKTVVEEHEQPNFWKAAWQIFHTVGAYVALWALIYLSVSVSWWLTIPLAILAGGLLVRLFIIFHDCGHGSFFRSPTANRFCGRITGLLAYHWKWEHDVHHGTAVHTPLSMIGGTP